MIHRETKVNTRVALQLNKIIIFVFLLTAYSFGQSAYQNAISDFESGNYKSAALGFEKYFEENPSDVVAFQYLVNSYLQLKEYQKAIPIIENGIKEFPINNDLKLILAKLYLNERLFLKSEKILVVLEKQNFEPSEVKDLLSKIYFNFAIVEVEKSENAKAIENLQKAEKYGMKNPELYALKSQSYIAQKDNGNAEKTIDEGLKYFSQSELLQRTKAILLIEEKKYEDAIEIIEPIWGRNKSDLDVGLQLAILYRAKNKVKSAFDIYNTLLEIYPKERRIYNDMKSYFILLGKQSDLRQLLENMKTVFPNDKSLDYEIAESYIHESQDSTAILKYEEMQNENGLSVELVLKLSELYEKTSQIQRANKLLNSAIEAKIYDKKIFLNLGKNLESIDDFEFARLAYQRFISAYPNDSEAFLKMGELYKSKENYEKAKDYFKEGLDIEESPELLFGLAEIYKQEKDAKTAVDFYKKVFLISVDKISENQNIVKTKISNSKSLQAMNDDSVNSISKETIENLKSIVETSFENIIDLANAYEAETVVSQKLSENPHSSILLYFQAEIFFKRNELNDAEKYFLMALNTNSSFEEAHIKLGEIYMKQNKIEKAILSYKRVLGINPKSIISYNNLINLYKEANKLSQLCDEWIKRYSTQEENTVLREHLIEALHKANRMQDAKEILRNRE